MKADISENGPDISGAASHIDPMIPVVMSRGSSDRSRHSVAHISWRTSFAVMRLAISDAQTSYNCLFTAAPLLMIRRH
jgi:hypothetical protein